MAALSPAALLARLPGCSGLDATRLDRLVAAARIHDFAAGAPLIAAGEPAPDWYAILVSGGVRVTGRESEGAGTLDELGPGDVLDAGQPGESAAWAATAVEATRCLLVPRAAVAAWRGRLAAPVDLAP